MVVVRIRRVAQRHFTPCNSVFMPHGGHSTRTNHQQPQTLVFALFKKCIWYSVHFQINLLRNSFLYLENPLDRKGCDTITTLQLDIHIASEALEIKVGLFALNDAMLSTNQACQGSPWSVAFFCTVAAMRHITVPGTGTLGIN